MLRDLGETALAPTIGVPVDEASAIDADAARAVTSRNIQTSEQYELPGLQASVFNVETP